MKGFKKYSRIWWVLAADDGCLLAKGNLNPDMPPYHLDAMTDHVPALVAAPNKFTLRDVRRQWNDMVRAKGWKKAYGSRYLVHERNVRITIEEVS